MGVFSDRFPVRRAPLLSAQPKLSQELAFAARKLTSYIFHVFCNVKGTKTEMFTADTTKKVLKMATVWERMEDSPLDKPQFMLENGSLAKGMDTASWITFQQVKIL